MYTDGDGLSQRGEGGNDLWRHASKMAGAIPADFTADQVTHSRRLVHGPESLSARTFCASTAEAIAARGHRNTSEAYGTPQFQQGSFVPPRWAVG